MLEIYLHRIVNYAKREERQSLKAHKCIWDGNLKMRPLRAIVYALYWKIAIDAYVFQHINVQTDASLRLFLRV